MLAFAAPLISLLLLIAPVPVQQSAEEDDIDAFMATVLERREINWNELYNYVFSETINLGFRGFEEIAALQSINNEYTWYVKDGYLVRSPLRRNGVEVSAEERAEYEQDWIEGYEHGDRDTRIERDAFFGFEFEPGNYYFAGWEEFEGRRVVKVEYYPEHLFSDEESDPDDEEDRYEIMFDKTSLVTMLIVPDEHQIVKLTFDNVGLEFLPGRWLVRLGTIEASMVMDRPYGDIWLPREITASASVTAANGTLAVSFERRFFDYRETEVGAGVVYGRPKKRR